MIRFLPKEKNRQLRQPVGQASVHRKWIIYTAMKLNYNIQKPKGNVFSIQKKKKKKKNYTTRQDLLEQHFSGGFNYFEFELCYSIWLTAVDKWID